MPDIASFNAIDVGNIASINGQDVASGGLTTPSEGTTGMLYFERAQAARSSTVPDTDDWLPVDIPFVYKHALHSTTDIVKLRLGQYHYFGLDSSGVLYSAGYTNTSYLGRSIGSAGSGTAARDFAQSLTGVAKFDIHNNGAWAIKTDGTLWWCGSISSYAASGDTGQSTTTSSNGWLQFGSDTDWVDINSWGQYPQKSMAIKGGSGAQYLYVCGTNGQGGLPVGTTSGSTKPWTRAKSGSSTDLNETFNAGGLELGYQNGMAVAANGKLYAWGEGSTGVLGTGNTTDVYYATQVGSDTDWSKPFVYSGRNAGLCIKTDGTLYMSTSTTTSLGIQPSAADRTYRQVGTDSDFEDIKYVRRTTSGGSDLIFVKKNGAWYANWDSTISYPHSFGGTSSLSAPTENTFTALNDFLQGSDVTATITEIEFQNIEANSSKGLNLWICTSTS